MPSMSWDVSHRTYVERSPNVINGRLLSLINEHAVNDLGGLDADDHLNRVPFRQRKPPLLVLKDEGAVRCGLSAGSPFGGIAP